MKLRIGNMWDFEKDFDCFLVTANSTVKRSGELVMGRGAAAELKARYPEYPAMFGSQIAGHPIYGVLIMGKLGVFQVKYHFSETARLELIAFSCGALCELAQSGFRDSFSVNFPGIGWGGAKITQIMPFVSMLPDNVTVWLRDKDELGAVANER